MSSSQFDLSASEMAARVRRGAVSPVELVKTSLEAIRERNPKVNAFVTVIEEEALEAARQAETALETGEPPGPLHGVPIGIKDLFDFKAGVRNTFGSVPFEDFVPEQTTAYVQNLEDAGAIVVGKCNTSEFGHKGTTDNRLFGATSTPFDLDRNAGGSSGGSAAAVAEGLVPLAQAADGGGSVRIPAAWCGAYGFTHSFGRVPQDTRPDGFLTDVPFVFQGPVSRTVEDAAVMASAMAGLHPRDPFSIPDEGVDYVEATRRGVEGWRIAYSPNLDVYPIEEPVRRICREAVLTLEEAGAHVEEVELGVESTHEELTDLWLRQIGVLYHSGLEGFKQAGIDLLEDHRGELEDEFVRLLERTRDMSALEYKRDSHLRTQFYDTVQDVFERYDLLVTPTLAALPVKNAEEKGRTLGPTAINGRSVEPTIGWCLTFPFNFTGHPAASIPAGFTEENLPVGLQLVGNRFRDEDVLAASGTLERVNPWHDAYPPRS